MRRRLRLNNVLATAFASSMAFLTIIGLFAGEGFLGVLAGLLLQIVLVLVALATLLGLLNLLRVHLGRITGTRRGWPYSLVLVITAFVVIVVRILDLESDDGTSVSAVLFETLQVSLESALGGLLFFFLVFAAMRLLDGRVTWSSLLFTLTLLFALAGSIPLGGLDVLSDIRDWLVEVPVEAGSRGLLIGIGLGTVTVGIRVLIGQERAYREE